MSAKAENKIVFMGTPDFAVESLRQLLEAGINVAAVITAPDRKSGRGQKVSQSAVKKFAVERELKILQPESLKDVDFIDELKQLNADLFVVVAFRMLPEVIWSMPPKGTINLHASLLPQYRGAAPINWAVINGETKSGATTFFIEKEIDTGKIISQAEVKISKDDNAGDLHDELMVKGAKLLTKTVQDIFSGDIEPKDQLNDVNPATLKPAPKIFRADCKLDWYNDCETLYNMIRGLSPYPTAWAKVKIDDDTKSLKIFSATYDIDDENHTGAIKQESDRLLFGCHNGWIIPKEIQMEGKKRMTVDAFVKGYDLSGATLE